VKSGRLLLPIAGVAAPLLFLFTVSPPESNLLWRTLFSAGHAPLFGVIALSLLTLVRRHVSANTPPPAASPISFLARLFRAVHPAARPYLAAFLLAALLGAATEVAQLFVATRSASWTDWLRDMFGAAAFLSLAASLDRSVMVRPRLQPGTRAALAATGVVLLVTALYPVLTASRAYSERAVALPTVLDLGASWQRSFLEVRHATIGSKTSAAAPEISDGHQLTPVHFGTGEYPGIEITETFPDWRSYDLLTFHVYFAESEPVEFTLRIHDYHHDFRHADRFNRTFEVAPGLTRIVVALADVREAPMGRTMDMAQIRSIIVFAPSNARPFTLELSPFVLE
jgi:hypothetical protein